MTSRIYLLVEGLLDVAFLGRLLTSHFKFSRVQYLEHLGDWKDYHLNNFKYPKPSRHGQLRIDDFSIGAPEYYQSTVGPRALVALRHGNGDQMWEILKDDLEFLRDREDYPTPDRLGIIGDIDEGEADDRYAAVASKLAAAGLAVPAQHGTISSEGHPRVGVFLIPGEGRGGTIEDVLLALGEQAYPVLRKKADIYVAGISAQDLAVNDAKALNKPAGRKKAVVGSMTAILKPEFATARSIREDRWLTPEIVDKTIAIQPCVRFLTDLLGIASPSAG